MSFTPANFNVWAEIPVSNLSAGMDFYAKTTGGNLFEVEMGGDTVAFLQTENRGTGVSANLFVGEPGPSDRGPVVFLIVDGSVEEAAARCTAAGGRVLSEVVTIPPGRFVYAADPDGNRIGLFEAAKAA